MLKGNLDGNIKNLASTVLQLKEDKIDHIIPLKSLESAINGDQLVFHVHTTDFDSDVSLTKTAQIHLANQLNIPTKFFNTLSMNEPDILSNLINRLTSKSESYNLFRMFDGPQKRVRAILSNQYKIIDNEHVLNDLFQFIPNDFEVLAAHLTDDVMILKVGLPLHQSEVVVGDPVQLGFTLKNSEVGDSMLSIMPMLYRLVCTNGMIMAKSFGDKIRKRHLGARMHEGFIEPGVIDALTANLSHDINRMLASCQHEESFVNIIDRMRSLSETKVDVKPEDMAERFSKIFKFTDGEMNRFVTHYNYDNTGNRFGVVNAITRMAHDQHVDFDRANELEELGGRLIQSFTESDWNNILTIDIE